jgi:hypothetical protein
MGVLKRPTCIGVSRARNYCIFYSVLLYSILFYSVPFLFYMFNIFLKSEFRYTTFEDSGLDS